MSRFPLVSFFLKSKKKCTETDLIIQPPLETTLNPAPSPGYGSHYRLSEDEESGRGDSVSEIELEHNQIFTVEEREMWQNKAEFLLSLIGYVVGLTNVWRFPYLAQQNGGGAFLIPYLVMVIVAAVPLLYLELAVGQRFRKGAIGVWNEVSPTLGGVGVCSLVVSFYLCMYYTVIMGWCLVYLSQSFQSPLPWASCPQVNTTNGTLAFVEECVKSGPTSYFWYRTTLQQAPSLDYVPVFNWQIACGLLGAWVIIFLCTIKGIKSAGKVVYFTATFPYVVIIIFVIRGLTLDGAQHGLVKMVLPQWHMLTDPRVWLAATSQAIFSYGIGFGSIIGMASYNPVRNNFMRDTLITSFLDVLTSLLACVVVFCVLGFQAKIQYNQCLEENGWHTTMNGSDSSTVKTLQTEVCDLESILDQSASGTGLVFIVFTEAMLQMPGAPFWSVIFFCMLLTLGIDTLFAKLEGALTSLKDAGMLPKWRKEFIVGCTCLIFLVTSLIFCTTTGPYVFELFDKYCAGLPIVIVGIMEVIAIAYVYGLRQMVEDIYLMLGRLPSVYWLLCWRYLIPLTLTVLFVTSFIQDIINGVHYLAWDPLLALAVPVLWPWWCQLGAAFLVLSSVLWIPSIAILTQCGWSVLRPEIKGVFPREKLVQERGLTYVNTRRINKFQRVVWGYE